MISQDYWQLGLSSVWDRSHTVPSLWLTVLVGLCSHLQVLPQKIFWWGLCTPLFFRYTVRMFNKVQQRLKSKVEAYQVVWSLTTSTNDHTIVFMFNRAEEAEMSDKTFAVAGWSVLKGVLKQRFAKDLDRVKVLHRNGHTDIELWELPEAMTKPAASVWLMANHPRPRPVAVEQQVEAVVEQQEEVAVEQQEEVVAEQAEEPVTVVVENNDGSEDTVDEEALTFEEALEQIPLRENGRFLSRERREEMARELMTQA